MGKGGNGLAIHQGCDFETGNSKIEIEIEIRDRKPFFRLAHFPASFTRSLNDSMIQSPDGPILLFSLCPFSPFPVSPFSLSPFYPAPPCHGCFHRVLQAAEGLLYPAIAFLSRLEGGVGPAAEKHSNQTLHLPLHVQDCRLPIAD